MTTFTRRTLGLGASAATLSLMLGKPSLAQAYPAQDIHFIVGFAPGSGPDLITRWVADRIKPHLANRTIIVENKVGAGGNIASEYVARAKPDGYVVYVTGGSALAASAHLFKNPPVDVLKAFDSIATLARQPTLVAVGVNAPYKTFADLQKGMRSKADKASFGTAFPTARVLGAMIRDSAGGKAVEVQYRTSADWINDLANGSLDFGIIDSASGSGHARTGRIRILAVSTAERFSTMPEIPTLKEGGLNVDMFGWWAAYAPAGTPAAILDQLHTAFTAVVKSPEAKAFFNGITNEPWAMTRAQAHQVYLKEYKDWGEYVRIAKIEPQG